MYNFVYDNINSCRYIEYYSLYKDDDPILNSLDEIICFFINRQTKKLAFIFATDLQDESEIYKIINHIIDMRDFLQIKGYSIDNSYKYLINKRFIEYLDVNII